MGKKLLNITNINDITFINFRNSWKFTIYNISNHTLIKPNRLQLKKT